MPNSSQYLIAKIAAPKNSVVKVMKNIFFKLLIFKMILCVYLLMAMLGEPGLLPGCGAWASPGGDFSCGACQLQ